MTLNKETIQTIIGVCVLLGIMFGAVTYFATASDLKQVAMRLENKIVSDQIIALSMRMWLLEDRYPGRPDCSTWIGTNAQRDRQEYKYLKLKLEELKRSQKGN